MKLSRDDIKHLKTLDFKLKDLAKMREEEVRDAIREKLPRGIEYDPMQALDEGLVMDAYQALMQRRTSKVESAIQKDDLTKVNHKYVELFLEQKIPALKRNLSLSHIPPEVAHQVSQTRFDDQKDVSQLVHLLVGHELVDLHQEHSKEPKRRMLDLAYVWSNELLHACLQRSKYCAFVEDVTTMDPMRAVTSTGWVKDVPVLGGLGLLYLGRQAQLDNMDTNPNVLIYNIGPSIGAHESFITRATCRKVYDAEHETLRNRGHVAVVGGGQRLKERLERITPGLMGKTQGNPTPALKVHDSLDTLADKAYSHTFVFSPHEHVTDQEVANQLGPYMTPNTTIINPR